MKPLIMTADIVSLSVILVAAMQFIPAIAGLLAVIWYSFVIYDRIKYGPELDSRQRQHRREVKADDLSTTG